MIIGVRLGRVFFLMLNSRFPTPFNLNYINKTINLFYLEKISKKSAWIFIIKYNFQYRISLQSILVRW